MPNDTSNPAAEPQPWSRYKQVRKILDDASGDMHPSYQGHYRFWNLPLAELLQLTLYGVRMIAPATSSSPEAPPVAAAMSATMSPCCHAPQPKAAPTAQPQIELGRGASSGLIVGLKGLSPFDGSQFPRLPWGGAAVSAEDIQFIEKWIDDGCPETDAPSTGSIATGLGDTAHVMALAAGTARFAASLGTVNAYRQATGALKVRKNINFLTPEELQRFRNALAKMKSLDAYEQDERSFGYWARIHASQCQHSWEQFLTWHRAYLYYFEQQLQDIDPTVTLPYWDWAADHDNVIISITDMGSSVALDNGVVPEAYRCWIDQQGLDALKAGGVPQPVLDKLATILGQTFSSGNRLFLAAGIKWGDDPVSDQAIIKTLGTINPLWHYQRWPGGNSSIIFEAYPSPEDVTRVLQIENFFSFGSGPEDNHFFGALENLHNLIHNFSGGLNPNYGASTEPMNVNNPQAGDMVNAGRTAFDPIFWAHHSNIDRLWSEWQKLNPSGGPDDPDDILSPWSMTVADTYTTAKLGYEYMQSSHVFPSSSQMPIARFVSQSAGVHPQVIAAHRRAEVRLHHVQYSTRAGFFIRVFLNQPDANAATPTTGNPHYVGIQNMFTGLCIGGPGHCAPPPTTPRRKFDLRARAHKTPAGFRIDCTDAVDRLRRQGDTDFQVTLVILNIDGTVATDALHMDGVSLNFFD
ncbi:MAG: tyrosinase family protein [Acidobacteriales bacterium]|nr:tyrosinase family protein [Terriglobales bacterium]